uniref:Ig-like domain-containing protein n=1 Tax=Cyprinus carpio TaxID=7962 RepID=A0A8C2EGB2_CYPCA
MTSFSSDACRSDINMRNRYFFFWVLLLKEGVFGVEKYDVMERDSVTLNPDDTKIPEDDTIQWWFGDKIIARMNKGANIISTSEGDDAGFKDRLKLDQTGSLTITNTRTTDSGLYEVTSTSTEKPLNTFNLTVYARLPVPDISRSSQNSSSSQQNCSLLCSVVNVGHVTLSWYKGNSSLSSISVSDLNRSLSLHLECLDDFYSCVINNPIRNQTTHLNTELCHPCAGTFYIYKCVCVCV